MRSALVAVALLVAAPTLAGAETYGPIRVLDRPIPAHKTQVRSRPAGTTSISHVIYVNSCMPGGCDLKGGGDDAANHYSSLVGASQIHMSPFPGTAGDFSTLVDCAKNTFLPFDVTIVSERPTTGTYSEIIVAGHGSELQIGINGGGVAPFIDCAGSTDNVITYMFAADSGVAQDYLCGGIAQETAHVFGLDHELNADDPMTYLNIGSHKTFQNAAAQCHDMNLNPAACRCFGQGTSSQQMQNSYGYLMGMFGPLILTPASMTIDDPKDGAYVKPGFSIHSTFVDQLTFSQATLAIDDATASTKTSGPYIFQTAGSIPTGDHKVTVTATDTASPPRTISASVNVHLMGSCAAQSDCTGASGCVGGLCYPDKSVAGGVGTTCTDNSGCITSQCGSDGSSMLCTAACVAGTCPSGMDCLDDGGAGICWPAAGGGCNVGGGGGSLVLVLGLGLAFLGRRRRA